MDLKPCLKPTLTFVIRRICGPNFPVKSDSSRFSQKTAFSQKLHKQSIWELFQHMVTTCANSSCNQLFDYFRGGKLFLFQPVALDAGNGDFQERVYAVECFWLCRECASMMTVISQGSASPTVVPLSCRERAADIES